MKKLALMLTCCMAVVCLVSCNKNKLVGNWKEVRSSYLTDTIGFTINKDGSMESFNTGYIRYEKWSQNADNELELQGVIVGGESFDETMTILKLTKDTLQFKDSGGYESTYVRISAAPTEVVGLGEMNK